MAPTVTVVGGGPAGLLVARLLRAQGAHVTVYERRVGAGDGGRSINLALSERGLSALALVGMRRAVEDAGVFMRGRWVHGEKESSKGVGVMYGDVGQGLVSVGREALRSLLKGTDEVEEGWAFVGGEVERGVCIFEKEGERRVVEADLVVGADGAYSPVRERLRRIACFEFGISYVGGVYKELSISGHDLEPGWLHVWPRGSFMLIGLPNSGGEYTGTLFMDKERFDALNDESKVTKFFEKEFPDALPRMPHLWNDWCRNPTPPLMTVRCDPFHFGDKAVLVGDAAHAIVPFYGQGCNAAFEDCRTLAELVNEFGWNDLATVLQRYTAARKENSDAIADLALDHYQDMASRSATRTFFLTRKLSVLANRLFPTTWLPLYSMISFSTIPYADAVRRSKRQDAIVGYCATGMTIAISIAVAVRLSLPWLSRHGNSPKTGP